MNVHFSLRGLQFVWDAQKAVGNKQKHGVDFETACQVFFDVLCAFVDASVPDQERSAVLGLDDSGHLLFVVHVAIEAEQVIRIISARLADGEERDEYENS